MRTLVFIFTLTALSVTGQTYLAEVPLPGIQTKGFYRILIDPGAMRYANIDLSNVRIVDDKNREMPYIVGIETPVFTKPEFKEYEIASRQLEQNCCTRIVLKNASRKPINNVSLLIRNAETHKQATMLGSDDRKTWYALKENFYLDAINSPDQTYEIRILNFPLSNYQYLLLNINDSTSAPLNILKAGYYETQTIGAVFSGIPAPRFIVSDSATLKQTVIDIQFDSDRLVDKLEFNISGQAFYHRHASLYEVTKRKNKKGKVEGYNRYIQSVELTSTHSATINLDESKMRHLILVVENDDNPPLQFSSVEAWQLNRYLTAFLENDKQYWLKFGDVEMHQPVYDLSFFIDSIPNESAVLTPGMIKQIGPILKKPKPSNFFTSKPFIWSAIILVAVFLIFMTFRMIREKAA